MHAYMKQGGDSLDFVNKDLFTKDTPFHEYLHPFIEALKIDRNNFIKGKEEYHLLIQERDNLIRKKKGEDGGDKAKQRSVESREINKGLNALTDRIK